MKQKLDVSQHQPAPEHQSIRLCSCVLCKQELMQQEVEARCAAEVHMTLCKTAEERKVLMEANSALKEQLNMYSDKFKG